MRVPHRTCSIRSSTTAPHGCTPETHPPSERGPILFAVNRSSVVDLVRLRTGRPGQHHPMSPTARTRRPPAPRLATASHHQLTPADISSALPPGRTRTAHRRRSRGEHSAAVGGPVAVRVPADSPCDHLQWRELRHEPRTGCQFGERCVQTRLSLPVASDPLPSTG